MSHGPVGLCSVRCFCVFRWGRFSSLSKNPHFCRKGRGKNGAPAFEQNKPLPRTAGALVKGRLEDDLSGNLQVEGLARTKAWGAVEVADGVADVAVRTDGTGSSGEVLAVEEVKHLGSQLQLHALRDGDVLDDREVHVGEAWAVEGVPGNVAERTGGSWARSTCGGCSRRHAERVWIDPGHSPVGRAEGMSNTLERILNKVQSWALRSSIEVERLSAMERD